MTSKGRSTVLRAFSRNIGIKLLSVVLGIVLFYGIRSNIGNTVTMTVPVRVDVAEGVAILTPDPATVKVTFRGALGELRGLEDEDVAVVVRPKAVTPGGSEIVRLRARSVQVRTDARVVSISPDTTLLRFDREVTEVFKVDVPSTQGTPLRGRVDIEYEPKEVTLTGPEQKLAQLREEGVVLQTEPIDVEGRVQSFTKSVAVQPPSDVWITGIDPPEVQVKINLVTELATRELTEIPVMMVGAPTEPVAARIEPEHVTLRLGGRAEVLNRLLPDTVTVFVDVRGHTPGTTYELPVSVYLPQGLELDSVEVEPRSVKLTVGE